MAVNFTTIMPVLAVDDIDRATRFYQDKLGCKVRRSPDDPTATFVEVGDSSWLLLYKSSFKRGETTVASLVVPDLEQCVSELRGRGLTFEEYDMPGLKTVNGIATSGDLKTAWFKDSEGNTVAISQETAEMMRRAA